jgi:hypothetical protein
MKKRTASVAGVILALALAVPAFPGTIPQSIVPEGARWIAHLDMERFVATKLYELLDKGGMFEIKNRDVDRWLKLDPAKDITGVTVFGFEPGGKGQIVIAVAGKFDKAREVFREVADNQMNPIDLAEHARFMQAECRYNSGQLPEAIETCQRRNVFSKRFHHQSFLEIRIHCIEHG